jgi:hypothetical protein
VDGIGLTELIGMVHAGRGTASDVPFCRGPPRQEADHCRPAEARRILTTDTRNHCDRIWVRISRLPLESNEMGLV